MFKIERGDKAFWILATALVVCLAALAVTIAYAASVV